MVYVSERMYNSMIIDQKFAERYYMFWHAVS